MHQGRVTKRAPDVPPIERLDDGKFSARSTTHTRTSRQRDANPSTYKPTIAPTRRTTPRQPQFRVRPEWHKWLGAGLLIIGVALAAMNDVMLLQPSLLLLPGGHNELYLVAGVAIAGYSTWFFGWFDRTR